jgi:uncharacterized protein (DUF1330 family)
MAAYLIANYTVTNPEGYAAYPPAVGPTLAPFGGELVVAEFESEVVEGNPAPSTVVVKFPNKQAARDWYNSDAYQAVINLRKDNTEGFLVFVDEFAPH